MRYKMKIIKDTLAIITTMSISLAGCAHKAEHFGEKYVSPAMYIVMIVNKSTWKGSV